MKNQNLSRSSRRTPAARHDNGDESPGSIREGTKGKPTFCWRGTLSAEHVLLRAVGLIDGEPLNDRERHEAEEEYRMAVQVLVGTFCAASRAIPDPRTRTDVEGRLFVPIPWYVRDLWGGRRTLERLEWKGLIQRWRDARGNWYSREDHLCARLGLAPWLVDAVVRANLDEMSRPEGRIRWRNLVDRTDLRDRRRVGLRESPADEIGELIRGPEVLIPYRAMLERCKEMLLVAEAHGRRDLRHRAIRGFAGMQAIEASSSFRHARGGWARFRPVYREGANGRHYGVRGSIQSLPRELKSVLLETPGSPWRNFDLAACHAAALSRLVGEINVVAKLSGRPDLFLDGSSLRSVVRSGWEQHVQATGLPRDIVKAACHAVVMGGRVTGPHSAVSKIVRERFGYTAEATEVFRRLERVTNSYRVVHVGVARFLEFLLRDRWNACVTKKLRRLAHVHVGLDGSAVVTNAAGGRLPALARGGGWSRRDEQGRGVTIGTVLSHILTGVEREWMGKLTCELDRLGIPYLDEHDGVVVMGHLPASAVRTATRGSLLASYARIEPKEFLPPMSEYERLAAPLREGLAARKKPRLKATCLPTGDEGETQQHHKRQACDDVDRTTTSSRREGQDTTTI